MSIEDIKLITNEDERHAALVALMAPMTTIEKLDLAVTLAEQLHVELEAWGLRMEAKQA